MSVSHVHYTFVNKTDTEVWGLQAKRCYFCEITLLIIVHMFFVYSFDLQLKVISRKELLGTKIVTK